MSEKLEDLTVRYEQDGIELVKELDKKYLSKGAWSTIMYLYQEWDKRKEEFGEIKVSIRRYQKRDGKYSQKSKFNISSAKQASEIIETLNEWYFDKKE